MLQTLCQVKQAMTMTEKILAKHSDRTAASPGENLWVRADKLLTHDVCGPGTFGIFQKEFGDKAEVGGWGWWWAGGGPRPAAPAWHTLHCVCHAQCGACSNSTQPARLLDRPSACSCHRLPPPPPPADAAGPRCGTRSAW